MAAVVAAAVVDVTTRKPEPMANGLDPVAAAVPAAKAVLELMAVQSYITRR